MEHISSSRTGPSFPAPPKPNLNFVFHNKLPKSGKVFIRSKYNPVYSILVKIAKLGYAWINIFRVGMKSYPELCFSTFQIIPPSHFCQNFVPTLDISRL